MNEDRREKIAAADKSGHFDAVRKEAQAKRSARLGREAGSRPTVNVGRPQAR